MFNSAVRPQAWSRFRRSLHGVTPPTPRGIQRVASGVGEIDGLDIIIEHQIFYVDMFQRRRNGLCIGRGRSRFPAPSCHRSTAPAAMFVRRRWRVNGVLHQQQECVQFVINSHWRGSGRRLTSDR